MLLSHIIATILKLHGEGKLFHGITGRQSWQRPCSRVGAIKYSAHDFSEQTLICLESILIFQTVRSLGQETHLPVFGKHFAHSARQ